MGNERGFLTLTKSPPSPEKGEVKEEEEAPENRTKRIEKTGRADLSSAKTRATVA